MTDSFQTILKKYTKQVRVGDNLLYTVNHISYIYIYQIFKQKQHVIYICYHPYIGTSIGTLTPRSPSEPPATAHRICHPFTSICQHFPNHFPTTRWCPTVS